MSHVERIVPPVLLIIFLVGFPQISETIYSPALPSIVSSLATTTAHVQWTLSIYFIGFAWGVFYWGRFSDDIGRRKVMLLGLFIYALGSFFCLCAQSITWLLIARAVQAFGASVGSVITMTIIRESFPDLQRQKVFALIGMALSFSPALGPFIGGYASDWFGWRANFAILVMIGLLLFFYTYKKLPETRHHLSDSLTPIQIVPLAKRLFSDPKIIGSSWIVAAINGILFSYYAEAPFIFINLIGLTPSEYGWLGIFIMGASLIGSYLSHQFSHRYTKDQLIYMGCSIAMGNALLLLLFVLLHLPEQYSRIVASLLMIIPIAGIILGTFGLILPVILSHALNDYKAMLGRAGALFGLSYYLLIAGFTWLMGLLHTGSLLPMPLYFLSVLASILFAYLYLVKEKNNR